MKNFNMNIKWVLTASLLALLTTQGAYQFSSLNKNNSGELNLSSEAAPSKTSSKQVKTEASSSAEAVCTTGECTVSVAEFNQMMAKISSLEAMIVELKNQKPQSTQAPAPESVPTAPATTVAQNINLDSNCDPARSDETRQERRDRLACEKEEREQAKSDALVERFEAKMERLQDRCDQDVNCLAEGFTSEISKYTGSKKLPAAIIVNYYRLMVTTPLEKVLYSSNPEDLTSSISTLQTVLQNLPEQYSSLKKDLLAKVQTQTRVAATKVAQSYSNLNTLSKQNNPEAYFQAYQQTQQDHSALTYLSNSYSSSIVESLNTNSDFSALDYYKKTYIPDMQKIMSSILSGTVQVTATPATTVATPTPATSTPATVSTTPEATTAQPATNTRDGRSNAATTTSDNKMTRDQNLWLIPQDLSGIQQNGQIMDHSRPTGGRQGRVIQ